MRLIEVNMEIEHEWRKIFTTYSKLKSLRVKDEFVEELPRWLRVDIGR